MYQLITTNEVLATACVHLKSHSWLGFDIETTALDPFDGVIRLVQLSTGETTYIIDLRKVTELGPLRDLLHISSPRKVAHNAKFDAKWARHHLGVEVGGVFCTMMASQLLAAGDADRKHSLAAAADYFLGVSLDKTEQVSDWGREELDPAQLEYAAKDAAILLPLKDRLWSELVANDLLRVMELENECVVPVLQMELNGFYLDRQAWQNQIDIVKAHFLAKGVELQRALGEHYPQPSLLGNYNINLDSPPQMNNALKWCGVPVTTSTQEWRMQPLVAKYPVVGTLLDYRGLSKSMSSYGPSWFGHINPVTGRIHAQYGATIAKTGRFGCFDPNLQQVPAESGYRHCFKAKPGNKLIIADYSQIELRILAYKSNDSNFISAFMAGDDFHAATASQVFNVPLGEVSSDQRSFAKRLNFGLVYGIGEAKFAALTNVSRVEAMEVMKKYFGTFQGLNRYIRDTGRQAVVDRVCRTESGRMMNLRFNESDKGAVAQAKRYGVNMPIQGTSADILKRALRLLHDSLRGTTGKLVNIVHDEIIVECAENESHLVSQRLHRAMVVAGEEFIKGVPIVVDIGTSNEWKK